MGTPQTRASIILPLAPLAIRLRGHFFGNKEPKPGVFVSGLGLPVSLSSYSCKNKCLWQIPMAKYTSI